MLTKLTIVNFKQFDRIDIDLGSAVVFIGPNNSGKTTALQALALWDAACKHWLSKRASAAADSAKGVTIGRKDLVYLPLPVTNAMWRDMRVRETHKENGKIKPKNVLIEIVVEGQDQQGHWSCGFEFDYASEEFFYCRPLRLGDEKKPKRMSVPTEPLDKLNLAFLPPMTGLLMEEPLLQAGRVNVLLGSGRSGETLRNLCYDVHENSKANWDKLVDAMQLLFGVRMNAPVFVAQTGSLELTYKNQRDVTLPLTSAGLGMQQTLLLLAYLSLKPKQILLLDEPDAHLEILRQRQIYNHLIELAQQQNSQIICASHSEVILNEAIDRDTVVAFVDKPHTVSGNKKAQVLKALQDWGFEHYVQAEQKGWVLYLEGSTDLAILKAWAQKLSHPALAALSQPYVHYLNSNLPNKARDHFNAIKEAFPALLGMAIFDRLDRSLDQQTDYRAFQWKKREIENYFVTPSVLLAFAKGDAQTAPDLIEQTESDQRIDAMRQAIAAVENALKTLKKDVWSADSKASEEVLPQIFAQYLDRCNDVRVPSVKGDYWTLIQHQSSEDMDSEVVQVLDLIASTHAAAQGVA